MFNNSGQFLLAQASPTKGASSQTAATAATTSASPKQDTGSSTKSSSSFSPLLFPLLLIVVFYFLLIRPQQKKEKKRKAMLKGLQKGDKVVTRGGVWGVVVGIKEGSTTATVKIATDVKIEVSVDAIEVVNPPKEKQDKK